MKSGIVARDPTEQPLKNGDPFYHQGKKVGIVKAVLSDSYYLDFEPDALIKEMSLEETMEAVGKGII